MGEPVHHLQSTPTSVASTPPQALEFSFSPQASETHQGFQFLIHSAPILPPHQASQTYGAHDAASVTVPESQLHGRRPLAPGQRRPPQETKPLKCTVSVGKISVW